MALFESYKQFKKTVYSAMMKCAVHLQNSDLYDECTQKVSVAESKLDVKMQVELSILEVDIEQQVEKKIKALPNLKEKVQAIAINGYLLEKRKLDKLLEAEIEGIELKFRENYKPYLEEINAIIGGKHTFTDADFQEIGELLNEQELETKHNYFTQEKIP
ncbi:unnamed protein product [Sphagnum balticum]